MSDQYHSIYQQIWDGSIRTATASFAHDGNPMATCDECYKTCNGALQELRKIRGSHFRDDKWRNDMASTEEILQSEVREALDKEIRLGKLPSSSLITVAASSGYVKRTSRYKPPGLYAVYPQIDSTIAVRDYTLTRSVDPWGPAKEALSELTEKTWVAHGRVRNEEERSIEWEDRDMPSDAASGGLDYGEEEYGSEQGSSHLTSGHRRDGVDAELRPTILEEANLEEVDEA